MKPTDNLQACLDMVRALEARILAEIDRQTDTTERDIKDAYDLSTFEDEG